MKVTTDGCLFGAWVSEQLKSEKKERKSLLDIGTGTGLLSLMIAQQNPELLIDSVELDKDAYEQANENIAHSPWAGRIHAIHKDIKEFSLSKQYEVIISNPPFYENELQSGNTQKNIAHHDKALLLEDLLRLIKVRLVANSIFYLLLPYKRKDEIESLFRKNNLFFSKKVFVRQSVNHDYFRLLIAGNLFDDTVVEEKEISIRDASGSYTPEFIHLLKDYYLHL